MRKSTFVNMVIALVGVLGLVWMYEVLMDMTVEGKEYVELAESIEDLYLVEEVSAWPEQLEESEGQRLLIEYQPREGDTRVGEERRNQLRQLLAHVKNRFHEHLPEFKEVKLVCRSGDEETVLVEPVRLRRRRPGQPRPEPEPPPEAELQPEEASGPESE